MNLSAVDRKQGFVFENTFKNIDDILHKDAGCGSELDYVEQSSWVLFLKYLDDLESARKVGAELSNTKYSPIIDGKYRWTKWAVPKSKDGKIDHNSALTGDDLKDFVNRELFPYLAKFKSTASGPDTLEYKIGEIFSEINNKLQSGYNLREVLELVDELKFQTSADIHEMSHLYEDKIKNMGNAGRNGGEYYTPRPLIKAMIQVVAPKIGQTIYDGAAGSAGFLCESFAYLSNSKQLTTKEVEILQKKTFYGKEKKSLAYIIGTMNMILHGVEAPNIIHTNTLAENLAEPVPHAFRDPDPRVLHRKMEEVLSSGFLVATDADHHFAGLRELHGIAHEIEKNLLEAGAVGQNRWRDIRFDPIQQFEALLGGRCGIQIQDGFDAFPEQDREGFQFEFAALDF